jgi:hypothetical protein
MTCSEQGIYVKKIDKTKSDPSNHADIDNKISLGDTLIAVSFMPVRTVCPGRKVVKLCRLRSE